MSSEDSLTVLVVDADPISASLLKTALASTGENPRIVAADSGSDALRAIDREAPDLIVTELRMPGATGREVLAYAADKCREIPVVVITGDADPDLRAEMLGSGACLVLEKPIEPSSLVKAVGALLAKGSSGFLDGFSLASVLQLVEVERKSCEVSVSSSDAPSGSLVFVDGRLADARAGDLRGDEAVLEILKVEAPRVSLREPSSAVKVTVSRDLTYLLLESARIDDEGHLGLEDLESLAEAADRGGDRRISETHRALLDDVAMLPGFCSASILDLGRRQSLLERVSARTGAESAHAGVPVSAICRLADAERGLTQDADGDALGADVLLRRGGRWHLLRGLTNSLALYLILDHGGNPALAQYRLSRWVERAG
ncbi:MAG: response regulator [Holophagales bacterium]|nr:response regulator [Holophagales bacterium]